MAEVTMAEATMAGATGKLEEKVQTLQRELS